MNNDFFWQIDSDPKKAEDQVNKLRKDRGYTYQDMITCSKDKLPNYEEKVNTVDRILFTTCIFSPSVFANGFA